MSIGGSVLRKVWQLSFYEKKQLFFIIYWLFVGKILMKLVPFRVYARFLGKEGVSAKGALNPAEIDRLFAIRALFLRVVNYLPCKFSCLVEAFAMGRMLSANRVSATIYFGVNIVAEKKIAAHAWLQSGQIDVVGCESKSDFKVINLFAI